MNDFLSNLFPNLPHLTLLSQFGFSICIASFVLYMLSRAPELAMVSVIALLYGSAPLLFFLLRA